MNSENIFLSSQNNMFTNWSIVILKYYLLLGLNPGVDLTRTYLGAELVELKKQVHAAICECEYFIRNETDGFEFYDTSK